MTKKLEGMFKEIPFDEAYKKIHGYEQELQKLKAGGAVKGGEKKIDKKYVALINESISYCMQFSKEELYAIIGKAMETKKNES